MHVAELRHLRRLGTLIAYARAPDDVIRFAGQIAAIVSRETERLGNDPAVNDHLEARLEAAFAADPPPAPRRARIDPAEPPAPRQEPKPVRPPADTLEERRTRRAKAAQWDSLKIGPFCDDPAAAAPELGRVGQASDGKSLIGSQLGAIASE